MPNQILDPTGGAGSRVAAAELAPRRASLRGVTVGLLANTKRNAAPILAELGELLRGEHGVAGVVTRTKKSIAHQVPEETLKELVRECDVVVTGVGDCGSCSASAVADGVAFENAGVPAAVICSDAFTVTANAMADRQGARGYRYVTTPHPIAALNDDGVRERARQVLPGVVALLTSADLDAS